MVNFVYGRLNSIFKDFRNEIRNKKCMCELKELNFSEEGKFPNYNNKLVQQFYLLRYLLGYFVEYVSMYREILGKKFLEDDLYVHSFGCGCGLDLWGLIRACDERGMHDAVGKYDGVDVVPWHYRSEFKGIFDVTYTDCNIIDKKRFAFKKYNVFIFPKSICEFKEREFRHIKDLIRNGSFSSNKMVVLGALRKTRAEKDSQRLNEIADVFKKSHRYRVVDRVFKISKNNGIWEDHISSIISGMNYPGYIKKYLKRLPTECMNYKKNGFFCTDSCEKILSRYPLEYMSQVAYEVIFLEKDGVR